MPNLTIVQLGTPGSNSPLNGSWFLVELSVHSSSLALPFMSNKHHQDNSVINPLLSCAATLLLEVLHPSIMLLQVNSMSWHATHINLYMMDSVMFVVLHVVHCMNLLFLYTSKPIAGWVNRASSKLFLGTNGFTSTPKDALQAPTHN